VAFGARIGIKIWALVAQAAQGGCKLDCAIFLKAQRKLKAEARVMKRILALLSWVLTPIWISETARADSRVARLLA
jgi:hypothetical protein